MHAEEMTGIGRTQPITCLGLHSNMAQLLVIGKGERIVSGRQLGSPLPPYLGLKSKIGSGSGPIKCIGLHHSMLSESARCKQ